MELSIDPIQNQSEILFIDGAINDIEHLTSGVSSSTEFFILDTKRDGISQISEVLAERSNISSIHIVSFGTPGSLQLGSANLTLDNLNAYSSNLSSWADRLTADADILLYGCNLAWGGDTTLLQQLSEMTGADIAASDDLTGNASLGGDWDLEVQVGEIETALAFSTDVQSSYQYVFDTFRIESREITEGDSGTTELTFTVTLDEALEEEATVDFSTGDSEFAFPAEAGQDYEEDSGTLTFDAGTLEQQIAVQIIGDTDPEADETFRVILSNPSDNANLEEGADRALATIRDDDALTVFADSIQVAEGSDAIFTLTLSTAATDPVTVEFTTQAASGDNAATPDEDFQTTSGSLTFNPGETEQTVVVSTIDNPELNQNQTFFLELTSVEGALIENRQIEATILDNDLSISGSKWDDLDGDGIRDPDEPGLSGVTIYLDFSEDGVQDPEEPFTTTDAEGNYTFANLIPGNYIVREQVPRGFAQTFPIGELTETGTISPQEPTEPIFGNADLSTGSGDGSVSLAVDAFGAFGSAVGTTTDATFDPIGEIAAAGTTFESGVAIGVGDSETRTFLTTGDIQGSGELDDPGFVEIEGDANSQTTNRAVSRFSFNGLDFTLTQTVRELFSNDGTQSGSLLTQTYNIFNPSSDTANFEFVRYFDGDLTFDGDFMMDGGGRLQTGGQEILFETDTAGEPATSTTFIGITGTGGSAAAPGRFEIDEFSGLAERIIAGQELDGIITGDDTGDETDEDEFVDEGQGFDLTLALRNEFNLAPGATTVYTTTTIFGSGAPEDIQLSEEGFYRLTLNPLEPIEGADFANTEVPFPDITVQEEVRQTEGDPVDPDPDDPDAPTPTNTLDFTVSLSEQSIVPVTVDFATVDGSATVAGNDYESTTGTLTFLPGETQKTVPVPITADTTVEPDETFFLQLSNPVNGRLANAQGVGIIISDDLPTVSIANAVITEGNSGTNDLSFEVSLSSAISQSVTLNFETVDGTATGGSDYQIVSGSLTFNPDETSKTIAVPIFGDTELESDETFFLRLSDVINATPTEVEGTGTILNFDDDNPDIDRPVSPPTPTPTPGSFAPPFDENFYLTQNPDVALAVANGSFVNGLDHYLQFGQFEGRPPSSQLAFDVTFYLTVNPDVALAVANGNFTSGLEHYILFGFSEGRSPVAI